MIRGKHGVAITDQRSWAEFGVEEVACEVRWLTEPGSLTLEVEAPTLCMMATEIGGRCEFRAKPDQPVDGCLVLRGEIVQCSYPGGFYRYAVRVGPRQYLVDDMRRLAIGEPIGIALPATALHLYPPAPAAE